MIHHTLNLKFSFILILIHSALAGQNINGLWLVEKVEIEGETMTPVARWMKFNTDGTQESGNGWLKHSEGTYVVTENFLKISNSNGTEDLYPPFEITYTDSVMRWKRQEDGSQVQIFLMPIEEIPASPANQLLGLWEISDSQGVEDLGQSKGTFFIRWDHMFVYTHPSGEKKYGVYKCHGHKNEIELIYYGDDCRREWWNYRFDSSGVEWVNAHSENQKYDLKRIKRFIY